MYTLYINDDIVDNVMDANDAAESETVEEVVVNEEQETSPEPNL